MVRIATAVPSVNAGSLHLFTKRGLHRSIKVHVASSYLHISTLAISSVPLPLFITLRMLVAAPIIWNFDNAPNQNRSHGSHVLVK